jgi:hypothetical protein
MTETLSGEDSRPFEKLKGQATVSDLLMSALRSIDQTDEPTLAKAAVEKINREYSDRLSAREKEILEDLDWWIQIYDSGDKERAKKYYWEKLKPSQTELEEKSVATN